MIKEQFSTKLLSFLTPSSSSSPQFHSSRAQVWNGKWSTFVRAFFSLFIEISRPKKGQSVKKKKRKSYRRRCRPRHKSWTFLEIGLLHLPSRQLSRFSLWVICRCNYERPDQQLFEWFKNRYIIGSAFLTIIQYDMI